MTLSGSRRLAARVHEVRRQAVVGLLADRARVEDEEIGVVGRAGLAEAERFEEALDPLGIVHVHLAAEGLDVVALHAPECIRGAA